MSNTTANAEYFRMFQAVKDGKITEAEWTAFCMEMLSDILEQNKDVFIRLKNR